MICVDADSDQTGVVFFKKQRVHELGLVHMDAAGDQSRTSDCCRCYLVVAELLATPPGMPTALVVCLLAACRRWRHSKAGHSTATIGKVTIATHKHQTHVSQWHDFLNII